MKKERDILKIKEIYTIEDKDSFKIERKIEEDNNVYFSFNINGKEIKDKFINDIEIGFSEKGNLEITTLRCFIQEDFDEIKKYFL